MPRYPAKKMPTADPKLNPDLATKLTERLVAETVHGHATIHSHIVNSGLTVSTLGDKIFLVMTGILGEPSKGDQKGEG